MATDLRRKHLPGPTPPSEQPLDLPRRPRLLRRISHLGPRWAQANLRLARKLRGPQLVLHRRRRGAPPGMASPKGLPQSQMDLPHQPPGPPRLHRRHAAGHHRQLQLLDHRRHHLQFLRFQVPQTVVAEVQLRSLGGVGCGLGFHGSASVFHVNNGG